MKIPSSKSSVLLGLASILVLSLGSARAQNTTFNVDINTSQLSAFPNDSFSLEFQLNPGGGTQDNTATISNFQFTGGSGISGTTAFFGNSPASATGDFASGITLNTNSAFTAGENDLAGGSEADANGFSIFDQNFDASVTDIKFTVTVSDFSGPVTPTDFIAAIYDNSIPAGGNYVQTTDPVGGISLITVDLGKPGDDATLQNFAITEVPEPSTYALMGLAGLGLLAWRRRFGFSA